MKKLLALVLALVMTLSLAVVGSNAAFKDADKVNETYAEAVDVLAGMKVFQGYTDGTFQPTGDITRAEVAAIVYRLYTADVTDAQASLYATYNKFNDMDGAAWAKGYIGYCGNAGLIKGYDAKTFGPSDKVTGYQALAMILRAVGYDAQGEFTGADWQLHVAQTAQQAGVLKNVKGVDLNAAASRELVAELLFRTAAEVPMVKYTPAFGYVANSVVGNQKTLGEQNFSLKLSTSAKADDWGRPANVWTYNTGNKKTTVVAKPVVSYTTKVAECDIAKDLGITAAKKIEAAFIDGDSYSVNSNAVTTNQYATIAPLATTSYVGAQGRLTEVYDMGTAGYRIVEINTYLAKVTKAVAATTDKNGHTNAAYSTLDIYVNDGAGTLAAAAPAKAATISTLKAATAEFAKDTYVLVTVNAADEKLGYVSTVAAAESAGVGAVTFYTSNSTTFTGDVKFDDADKLVLIDTVGGNKAIGGSWDALKDAYGNLIGLVPSAKNYLVVEAIEWKHDSSLRGGFAMADVILADGSRQQNVTIAGVGTNKASCSDTGMADVINAKVSDRYTQNTAFYNHIYNYTVDSNGAYVLSTGTCSATSCVCVGTDADNQIITKGQSTITNGLNVVVADNNTVFMVKNPLTGVYTTYVGKDNVPSMTKATICYLVGANGYASIVVVSAYELANNTFVAYVTTANNAGVASIYGTAYDVYKLGETTTTRVYDNASKFTYAHDAGLYTIQVNDNQQIVSMTALLCSGVESSCATSWPTPGAGTNGVTVLGELTGDRTSISGKTGTGAGVFKTADYTNFTFAADNNSYTVTTATPATPNKDFVYDDNTTFIVATYDNRVGVKSAVLTKGSSADLEVGNTALVVYSSTAISGAASYRAAKYVYILKASTEDINVPTTPATLTLVSPAAKQVQATYTTGSKASDVKITYYYRVAGTSAWSVMYEGITHNYAANAAADVYSAKTVPASGSTATYEVYAQATSMTPATLGAVVATSNTITVIA